MGFKPGVVWSLGCQRIRLGSLGGKELFALSCNMARMTSCPTAALGRSGERVRGTGATPIMQTLVDCDKILAVMAELDREHQLWPYHLGLPRRGVPACRRVGTPTRETCQEAGLGLQGFQRDRGREQHLQRPSQERAQCAWDTPDSEPEYKELEVRLPIYHCPSPGRLRCR